MPNAELGIAMRVFFRFSIRDLLFLTLVVAMGLGWFVREREFRAESDRTTARANKWRMVAGALERVLKDNNWNVEYDFPESVVNVNWPAHDIDEVKTLSASGTYYLNALEPSTNEE